jgi:glycosyltransferase involved in cell wall biosynthesis
LRHTRLAGDAALGYLGRIAKGRRFSDFNRMDTTLLHRDTEASVKLPKAPRNRGPAVLYTRFGLSERELPPRNAATDAPAGGDPSFAVVAAAVDPQFYRARYPDIADAKIDPARHYYDAGWKERRNPNPWFDTAWYLEAYQDIQNAGINPLYHYVVAGRTEGRQPLRPGGQRRPAADQAVNPILREPWAVAPRNAQVLDHEDLCAHIQKALPGSRGFVLAASHDRYIDVTGGVQVLIADEQRLFATNHVVYLHISPALARLTLGPEDPEPAVLQVVLDGVFIGLIEGPALTAALGDLAPDLPPARLFALHSFFGHRTSDLIAAARAMQARDHVFWLHDYASVCDSYNLLRDHVEYCRGPAPGSLACMVCVHGDTRPAYLTRMRGLFTDLAFHVLAPSRAALDIWLRAAHLPYLSARVHENAMLEPLPAVPPKPRPLLGTAEDPVRVAFAGFPTPQKGWPQFLELVLRCREVASYSFFHFASGEAMRPMDNLVGVPTRVSAANRMAMVNGLAEQGIDLLLVLSPWPETFSYVAYEGFCSGADVVTLADTGNVGDAVCRHRRGVVLANEQALYDFFLDGAAIAYVQARTEAGREAGRLRLTGTTATVDLAVQGRTSPGAMQTLNPGLTLLVGDKVLYPQRRGDIWRFTLGGHAGRVRLLSRRMLPEQDGGARTRIGVAVTALALDGEDVPAGDRRRVAGWRKARDGMQWTDGDALIDAGSATTLDVTVRLGRRYLRLAMAEW